MFMRMDRLLIDIPRLKEPDPNAAAAIQELLGGKFKASPNRETRTKPL
ncbi:hypothetical protein PPOLYM_02786 [Paenibacillus polymyxa]|nr:hypothetical protein PPOLYM_02786 [Paenibacillus polymyxa]